MDRTPSPPRRVRTPPAPFHGPKHDNYEPFSPRRSSRVAAQHTAHLHPHLPPHPEQLSPVRKRTLRAVTPTSSRQRPVERTAHFALSPPCSPASPAKVPSPRSPYSTRRSQYETTAALDSDSDVAPTPSRHLLATMAPHGMLPTPAKTPRKRVLHTEHSLRPTARVLFANRPSTVEDAMPTPRKARKSVLEPESFDEQMGTVSPTIGVYVDSKDRVPDREDEENNPFVSRRGRAKAKDAPKTPRKVDDKTRQIFEAAARDEGIIYTHRGKKIFRQFDDITRCDDADVDPARSSDDDALHKAHRNGNRRITRSAIKPKLLFKEEIDRLKRENGEASDVDEEEAPTDIELPMPTPSRRTRHIALSASFPEESTAPVTKTVKRQISFDSWSRVKSASRASGSVRAKAKRSGSPLQGPEGKRVKSEQAGEVEQGRTI